MNKSLIRIFVFFGASGSGKNTCEQLLLKAIPKSSTKLIKACTRDPRYGEKEGRDYFFWTKRRFLDECENDNVVSPRKSHFDDTYYGYPVQHIRESLKYSVWVSNAHSIYDVLHDILSLSKILFINVVPIHIRCSKKNRLLRCNSSNRKSELLERMDSDDANESHIFESGKSILKYSIDNNKNFEELEKQILSIIRFELEENAYSFEFSTANLKNSDSIKVRDLESYHYGLRIKHE